MLGVYWVIDVMNPMKTLAELMLRRLTIRGKSTVRTKIGCVAGGLLSARHSLSVIMQFESGVGGFRVQKINFGWSSIGAVHQSSPPQCDHPFSRHVEYPNR